MTYLRPLALINISLCLGGLSLLSACSSDMQAARASFNELLQLRAGPTGSRDPNYSYLQVQSPQGKATLALGYRLSENDVEVWFSADKTTFYLQQGRYLSSKNMALNWQETRIQNAPNLSQARGTYLYTRQRMVMPGYQGPIQETVSLESIASAPSQAPSELKKNMEWLKESVSHPISPQNEGVIAYYARDPETKKIVWSLQCLSANYCISWAAFQ